MLLATAGLVSMLVDSDFFFSSIILKLTNKKINTRERGREVGEKQKRKGKECGGRLAGEWNLVKEKEVERALGGK